MLGSGSLIPNKGRCRFGRLRLLAISRPIVLDLPSTITGLCILDVRVQAEASRTVKGEISKCFLLIDGVSLLRVLFMHIMVFLYGSLVWVISLAIPTVSAQPSSPTTTSPSSTSTQALASIVPGSAAYGYFGCYNETTSNSNVGNVRALAGGNMVRRRRDSSPP